ncbi:hypothetical protein RO3G_02223 [Rhizopus delemar RA 99-880]|uniref:Uncharacterized protein n=1 Tax=Rhizopus delemar (strain RA 99-880 / ATCC MYA-4621 / FGSC 9543 / NRRL 43880) TaxID=246409 RepID=I1BMT9_RHIO9|nr:hypothetical protein RO3G_02223 [Rhizopus delemar RA 99-880]|eukprot:EIE77519.1 hypothetical protein RO3G_02223 [Rhizopus delemar RA 99-880]
MYSDSQSCPNVFLTNVLCSKYTYSLSLEIVQAIVKHYKVVFEGTTLLLSEYD